MRNLRAEVIKVLATHRLHASMNICTGCAWRATPEAGSLADQHEAHRADALMSRLARFVDGVLNGEGGMPKHLPMGVNAEGQGPVEPEPAHHYVCWCNDPDCKWTKALKQAQAAGVAELVAAYDAARAVRDKQDDP